MKTIKVDTELIRDTLEVLIARRQTELVDRWRDMFKKVNIASSDEAERRKQSDDQWKPGDWTK